ncbi:thiol-disulfide isomerase and thioredoxin [Vibrio nigripulchritudo]|nr:thiol:disulfide interchange protein DsbA/DsbL [Vibrio nigripulchritudo]KJY76287.1 thiol-disulfide isomerase and thioredoxin [Vibrio nigripulchritudo]
MIKRKFSSLLILFSALFLIACSDDGLPKQGTHFQMLPTELDQTLVSPVTEVFSLNCGHCRNMEKFVPELEDELQKQIGKVHVTFNESAQISALIYYAAAMQVEGVPDHIMMDELFAAAQMGSGHTQAEIKAAMERVFHSRDLVSPYDFDESMQQKLFKEIEVGETVTQRAQINAVPTFIVNGKYQVVTSGHKDIKDIAKTINYLLSL